MRFAYAALALFTAGTAVFLACSSDGTPVTPSGSTSGVNGTSGSSGNPNDGGGGTNNDVDAGEVILSPATPAFPKGCVIHCTEHQKAGKFESVPRPDKPDGVAWTNPEGAAEEKDNNFASFTLQEGQETAYLQVSNFDFSMITDDKLTWGISVELARHAQDAGIDDATIEVTIVGKPTRNKVDVAKPGIGGTWPRTIVGVHHYGQAIDTWGVDLYPADVRPATFGARIAAKHVDGISGPVYGTVDSLRVSVCYCNADGK